jgi:hypothetical protein
LIIVWNPASDVPPKWVKKAYTPPWLSVRTVQPSNEPCVALAMGGATWCVFHVIPPSRETATIGFKGKAFPPLNEWKSE